MGAPLLLHALPLRVTHALIPLIHLGTCLALLLHPTLGTGALAYMTFKGLDYSLFRAGKEILYIPLSFDMRYRAKEVIDAFVYRFSKGVMGGLTEGAGLLLALPGQAYPAVAMVAAVGLLVLPASSHRRASRPDAADPYRKNCGSSSFEPPAARRASPRLVGQIAISSISACSARLRSPFTAAIGHSSCQTASPGLSRQVLPSGFRAL